MIYYLIQTSGVQPGLAAGEPPPGLLSRQEQERFEKLRTEKRRRDWLLGRWTAKLLVQDQLLQETGEQFSLDSLEILSAPDGAPYIHLSGEASTYHNQIDSFSLSISHSNDVAFCALIERKGWRLGADIERIEPRSLGFASDYFAPEEIDRLKRLPEQSSDMYITAIWSAKEAVLKTLHLGLSVDTASVVCGIDLQCEKRGNWQWFYVELDYRKLGEGVEQLLCGRDPAAHEHLLILGWWQRWNDYILTLSTAQTAGSPTVLERIPLVHQKTLVKAS